MTTKDKAVVLLSGGIDSSTVLAHALSEGYDCYALSFDYAQRHKTELDYALKVAKALDVKKHLVIRFDLTGIGGSALTGDIDVPKEGGASPGTDDMIPVTYVPARNTIFLSFGLGWAEVLNAPDLFIGANIVDYSGYPDCRPEYLDAFEKMANLATKASTEGRLKFRVQAPLINLSKGEIINKGVQLGLDHSLTWSCYDPMYDISGKATPCRQCDSCRIRAEGFEKAGLKDPLIS
ncbi:MAG: 7-cyano-7-deazaguanine synthase QueC [Nitrospirota bacterium]|nr:MAG: 7-cyano-7-deazaguanine synthase QueC [Nitrospirota bacterium]